jgi:hypothetical protein
VICHLGASGRHDLLTIVGCRSVLWHGEAGEDAADQAAVIPFGSPGGVALFEVDDRSNVTIRALRPNSTRR